jgi:hypothetical protein
MQHMGQQHAGWSAADDCNLRAFHAKSPEKRRKNVSALAGFDEWGELEFISAVVPAKAGTHNHECWLLRRLVQRRAWIDK